MDFLNIWLPISGIEFSVLLLLTIGFCVGVLGGFFGVGGAWIVTPALNIFGFNMSFAIGTDLAHIFGKSIIATKKHRKMGNVDMRLGLISLIGSIVGVELGAQSIMVLERIGEVGPVVRWVYMALLFGLGIYMVHDYVTATRAQSNADAGDGDADSAQVSEAPKGKLTSLRIPPLISLPTSGIDSVSLPMIVVLFIFTGFLSGFLGVGGGFILLPSLIYLVGCPTTVAVGTSLLCVLFMGGYGCFTYSMKGRTELLAAMVMLVGAAIGAQIGVLATRYVRGYGIRILFAIMILLAGASVALKQLHGLLDMPVFTTLAAYVVMLAAGGMTLIIAAKLVTSALAERNDGGNSNSPESRNHAA